MSDYIDPVKWFEGIGSCWKCGKQATGWLRGPRNESYGAHCKKCAEARLNAADRAQAREAKRKAAAVPS